jgi:hypothetical protein
MMVSVRAPLVALPPKRALQLKSNQMKEARIRDVDAEGEAVEIAIATMMDPAALQ